MSEADVSNAYRIVGTSGRDACQRTNSAPGITGAGVEGYSYDAYGYQTVILPGPDGILDFDSDDVYLPGAKSSVGNPFLFTGQRYDPETGLLYYKARHVSTFFGRFMQRDPMDYAAGDMSLYEYVRSNPTNRSDWSGLITKDFVYKGSQWQARGAETFADVKVVLTCPIVGGPCDSTIKVAVTIAQHSSVQAEGGGEERFQHIKGFGMTLAGAKDEPGFKSWGNIGSTPGVWDDAAKSQTYTFEIKMECCALVYWDYELYIDMPATWNWTGFGVDKTTTLMAIPFSVSYYTDKTKIIAIDCKIGDMKQATSLDDPTTRNVPKRKVHQN